MTTKRCDHCKIEKDILEFNWKFKALGVRHNTCRECMKWFVRRYFQGDAHDRHLAQVKERKQAAREFAREYVWQYLLTHPASSVVRAIHVSWNFTTGTQIKNTKI